MNKNILVTGGCGFIGSHFVRRLIKSSNYNVFNLDNLSYAGDLERLRDIEDDRRYRFIKGDIRKTKDILRAFSCKIDAVVHFAAQSHVDNSIKNPFLFEEVNAKGTLNLLETAREKKVKKFIHISTDEVYGDIENGKFTESSPLRPNSPYSASKAAGDCFVRAYMRTYNFPAIIARPSNNYGPWQYPEKFIPVVICRALKGKRVPVYAKGLNQREWLYVEDCVKAVQFILEKAKVGQTYNIGSGVEKRNIDVAQDILRILGKPLSLIKFVKDRAGHDFRYSLNSRKIRDLGWASESDFSLALRQTINWYKDNLDWAKKDILPQENK